MLTQTVATVIKSATGGTVVSQSVVFSADAEHDLNNVVPAGGNLVEAVAVDVSAIESFYIYSDKAVTVTPYNGASATADGPFTIAAKTAIYWNTGRVEACPLAHDFTSLHFHNAGVDNANVKAGFLVNAD